LTLVDPVGDAEAWVWHSAAGIPSWIERFREQAQADQEQRRNSG